VLVRLAVLKAWGQTTKFRIFYVVIFCIRTHEYVIDTNTGFNATAKRECTVDLLIARGSEVHNRRLQIKRMMLNNLVLQTSRQDALVKNISV
jgi:hypothetical protein